MHSHETLLAVQSIIASEKNDLEQAQIDSEHASYYLKLFNLSNDNFINMCIWLMPLGELAELKIDQLPDECINKLKEFFQLACEFHAARAMNFTRSNNNQSKQL